MWNVFDDWKSDSHRYVASPVFKHASMQLGQHWLSPWPLIARSELRHLRSSSYSLAKPGLHDACALVGTSQQLWTFCLVSQRKANKTATTSLRTQDSCSLPTPAECVYVSKPSHTIGIVKIHPSNLAQFVSRLCDRLIWTLQCSLFLSCLVGWMFSWLFGWLVGWLVGCLDGWLDGLLVDWLAGWLFGCLLCRLIGVLRCCLTGWLMWKLA